MGSLVEEDATYHRATGPLCWNYGACTLVFRVVTLAERTVPNLGTSQDLGKLGFVLGSLLVWKVKAA